MRFMSIGGIGGRFMMCDNWEQDDEENDIDDGP